MARDSCLSRITAGVAVGGAVGGAVGAVYGTYEAIRYKVPGLLKIRYIGQTTLGSAAIFANLEVLTAIGNSGKVWHGGGWRFHSGFGQELSFGLAGN
ncbi:Reactive oxygen species modulator 1 [Corchorus capsularis]|uniref:Reactive oxygen species modulator 1 n=1 Tax=Corchorus capsularis TaxID=210143 RepID=A0A1R3K1P9_COCAP|nr:Reactive oxygen species modulator 1 [Corchorus capsularis]